MEIVLIMLMALTGTGVSVWAISRGPKNRIFRFTSFKDDELLNHSFLVYAPDLESAKREAQKMVVLNDIEIQKIEELEVKTKEVVGVLYMKEEKSSIKIKKI